MKRFFLFLFLLSQIIFVSYSAINISSCQNLDSGFLGLEREVYLNTSISTTGDCILISVDNVTLDCNNYNLTGDGTSGDDGIVISAENVTVRNCNVIGFYNGIGSNSNFAKLYSNNLIDNVYRGVNFGNSNSHIIDNLNTSNSGDSNLFTGGLIFSNSSNNIISNIISRNNNGSGIYFRVDSQNNSLSNIYLLNNTLGVGLPLDSRNISFQNLNALNNYNGVSIYSDSNSIIQSTISNNSNYGIIFENSPGTITAYDNVVSQSNINYNNYGIYFYGNNGNNSINSNNIINNLIYDIYFFRLLAGHINNTFFYSNILNSSSIESNDWSLITNNNYFNLSTQGNTYIDLSSNGQICFDNPTNNTCDYFGSILNPVTSSSLSSIFPSISTVSIFFIFFYFLTI